MLKYASLPKFGLQIDFIGAKVVTQNVRRPTLFNARRGGKPLVKLINSLKLFTPELCDREV